MNKLLLFMLVSLGVLASCGKEAPLTTANIVFTEGTITTPTLTDENGTTTISFHSVQAWTAEVEANKPWCTVSPASGDAGTEATLTISVDENDTYDERTAVVTIVSEGVKKPITITQSQSDSFTFTGVPTEPFNSDKNTFVITTAENTGTPTVKIEDGVDWITYEVTPASKGLTETNITFTVNENRTYDARSGKITISSGGADQMFNVNQKQFDSFTFTGVPTEPFSSDANTFVITTADNTGIPTIKIEDGVDWMTYEITPSTPESTQTKITFTISKNTSYSERLGDITISSGGKAEKFTVIQIQKDSFTLTGKPTEPFSPAKNTFEITVRENTGTPNIKIADGANWLTYKVTPATKGLTESKITFTLSENTSGSERVGDITISSGVKDETFSITQLQNDSFTLIGKPTKPFSSAKNTFEITVSENIGTPTVKIADGVSWLTYKVTPATKGLTETKITFTLSENTSSSERSGGVTISSGGKDEKFTVTQLSGGSFTLTGKPTEPFSPAKNTFEITVRENTGTPTVKIADGASWLTYKVTPATKGITETKITFTLSENTSSSERSGGITIASGGNEEKFTVTQLSGESFTVTGIPTEPFSPAINTFEITVRENTGTPTVKIADGANWLTYKVTPATKGVTETKITFTLSENTSNAERVGGVTISSGGKEKKFSVTQMYGDSFTVSGIPTEPFSPAINTFKITVIENTGAPTVKIAAGTNWLTYQVTSTTKGVTETQITFTLSENKSSSARVCNVTISSGATNSETFTVTQGSGTFEIIANLDANFKKYLLSRTGSINGNTTESKVDTNNDGEISNVEASMVTNINCNKRSIASLAGIEYFIALKKLECRDNQLTTIELSKNTLLTHLDCRENQLQDLNLSTNSMLTYLNCTSNQLKTMNLNDISTLLELYCSKNLLTNINISKNTELSVFSCFENKLKSIDLSKNVGLTLLYARSNQLEKLDISKNIKLIGLYCYDNKLTTLVFNNNLALEDISCYKNLIQTIDVSKNTSLDVLGCNPMNNSAGVNQLSEIKKAKGQKISIMKPAATAVVEI